MKNWYGIFVVCPVAAGTADAQLTPKQISEMDDRVDHSFVPGYPSVETLQAIQRDFLLLPRPIECRILKLGGDRAPNEWTQPSVRVELTGSALAFAKSHPYRDTLMALYGYIEDAAQDMEVMILLYGMTETEHPFNRRFIPYPPAASERWGSTLPEDVFIWKRGISFVVRNEILREWGNPYGSTAFERLEREPPPRLRREDVVHGSDSPDTAAPQAQAGGSKALPARERFSSSDSADSAETPVPAAAEGIQQDSRSLWYLGGLAVAAMIAAMVSHRMRMRKL